jgi:hypothetical protein
MLGDNKNLGAKPKRGSPVLVGLVVLIVVTLLVLGAIFVQGRWTTAVAKASTTAANLAPVAVNPTMTHSIPTAQVLVPTATPFVWDGTFSGVAEFYIDGDPNVVGWKVEKSEMSYICTQNFGVYISMDPGSVMTISTGELGAIAYVPCTVGKVVKFTTPYWSGEPNNHQNTHLVEIVKKLPDTVNYRDLLVSLKVAEKKPVAYMFSGDGKYEKITDNQAANPTQSNPAPAPVSFVWDGKFSGVAEYYIDGDPNVIGWKTKDAQMTYTCTNKYGVFITMDPGSVQSVSTGEFGAVAFVPCSVGKVVKLTTSFWSTSALHQQIHLVEIIEKLPKTVTYRVLLLSLKTAEGKPVAYMFLKNGKYKEIK